MLCDVLEWLLGLFGGSVGERAFLARFVNNHLMICTLTKVLVSQPVSPERKAFYKLFIASVQFLHQQ